jgi:hypothetical protein
LGIGQALAKASRRSLVVWEGHIGCPRAQSRLNNNAREVQHCMQVSHLVAQATVQQGGSGVRWRAREVVVVVGRSWLQNITPQRHYLSSCRRLPSLQARGYYLASSRRWSSDSRLAPRLMIPYLMFNTCGCAKPFSRSPNRLLKILVLFQAQYATLPDTTSDMAYPWQGRRRRICPTIHVLCAIVLSHRKLFDAGKLRSFACHVLPSHLGTCYYLSLPS